MSETITIKKSSLENILRRRLEDMEEGQSMSTTLFLIKEDIFGASEGWNQKNEMIRRILDDETEH